MDFLVEGDLVARQISGQLIDLHHHHRCKGNGDSERPGYRKDDGQCTRKMPALKKPDQGCQYKTEQYRKCDRYQYLTRKIQHRDNDRDGYEIVEGQSGRDDHNLLPR